MRREVILSDCLDAMRAMPDASVDAIVTDPPYGLSFMGAGWDTFGCDSRQPGDPGYAESDTPQCRPGVRYGYGTGLAAALRSYQAAMAPVFAEALRVARPGAHLLAFGGTRTYHRLACAVEDAGWEVRDCIAWVYGSGFPKSMDVAKAIDRAGGSPEASAWAGWGTALKPAFEPVVLARRPLEGTVAANVLKHGTGALGIDACRVPVEPHDPSRCGEPSASRDYRASGSTDMQGRPGPRGGSPLGRWPANLVHDGSADVLALFPESRGQRSPVTGSEPSRTGASGIYGLYSGVRPAFGPRGDGGGSAARFFYCAKASRSERGEGNTHPTVKPVALMRWLVRLVCRPGGLVLDPFCGSGTTGVACALEGMGFIGVERDPAYAGIARARLAAAAEGGDAPDGPAQPLLPIFQEPQQQDTPWTPPQQADPAHTEPSAT